MVDIARKFGVKAGQLGRGRQTGSLLEEREQRLADLGLGDHLRDNRGAELVDGDRVDDIHDRRSLGDEPLGGDQDGSAFSDVELPGDVARRHGDRDIVEHDLGFGAVALQQLGEVDRAGEIVGQSGTGGCEVADTVPLNDQSPPDEGCDRRPNGCPADIELPRQLVLGWQLIAGSELTVDQLLVQDLLGLDSK